MAIQLKLATDDTPAPWQAAEVDGPPAEELDYAREGLPTAPPKSWWRTLLAIARRIGYAIGVVISALLYAAAMVLLAAGTSVRYGLGGIAKFLLLVRRGSLVRLYQRLRWGRVSDAELA